MKDQSEGKCFFSREGLFKTIVHMAEPGKSPYKLAVRHVAGAYSALGAIR
jgi:hypothetical protein